MEMIRRAHKWAKLIGLVVTVMLVASICGCYKTEQEVISAGAAVAVPGLPGTYTGEVINTQISRVPNSNDYQFDQGPGILDQTGTLRLVPLKDNIYIVQARYDGQQIYHLMFCRIEVVNNEMHYTQLKVADQKTDLVLGIQNGVARAYDSDSDVTTLTGAPNNIMNFLLAHKDAALTESK